MKAITTNIIPIKQQFYENDVSKQIDFKAICCFVATGFFLDDDTYWKNQKVLRPATNNILSVENKLIDSKPWFEWHYTPRNLSFEQALDEFEVLFDTIIEEQIKDKKIILPLSGGIDSRMQAVALINHPNVQAYSYRFKGGYPEDKIGKKLAKQLSFPFTALEVQPSYLWNCIEELADINQCYSDFTHSRQMAFVDNYASMGTIFSLGHWGDVLFDGMTNEQLTEEEEVSWVLKRIIKKGGLELATVLWKSWNLEGDFGSYFKDRIQSLLSAIEISNSSAKLRAFKSMYWAPRWTSVNLSVFESVAPITLPFYDNRICEFICTIPEEYLANRKLQIAYIKRKSNKVAKITWHQQKPFNLNSFKWNKPPYNLPYRVFSKLKREYNGLIGKPHIARNWELQFLGKKNDEQLKRWLFDEGLKDLIPHDIIQNCYLNFKEKNKLEYAHPVSMLLTLSLFNQKFNK